MDVSDLLVCMADSDGSQTGSLRESRQVAQLGRTETDVGGRGVAIAPERRGGSRGREELSPGPSGSALAGQLTA